MDLGIVISLVIAFASLLLGFTFEGGALKSLLQPTAAIIVFGGTIGAVGISFPLASLKRIPKILKVAFRRREDKASGMIDFFKELAVKTRRDGLLSLESEIDTYDLDGFTKKGLQMVVDGVEPSTIRAILENKLENIVERHEVGSSIFDSAGGYAPTMGIVGTVMGLVQVLGNLGNSSELGGKIAVAFIATLYGVGSANLLWLPIAAKLKALDKEECLEKQMVIEGILLLQEGANPNTLVSKLEGFLPEGSVQEQKPTNN
ncbi:flagellar motor protein [Inconstantimicrobium mannanitabidum]|uniref:Chemotaxis protein MotA n=1 Tax=Inconstantimicrobium mannanitabidum TaxID=1604901 RepID=A0ACB5RH85_9CLOT|nr:flagellar motor protein [Clostridium sp. TW13]GKX68408.1 chemotaxis protein MotA [Clostridium sp. TW13]